MRGRHYGGTMTTQSGEVEKLVLSETPVPHVRRLTLNRPTKRNALSYALRTQLFEQLREADADPAINVIIIRGAGPSFSAGYDLAQDK